MIYPISVQDVTETIDPSLTPILLRETFAKAGRQIIKIDDVEIEYNENFR